MKRFIARTKDAIWDQLESWGLRVPRATGAPGPRVSVLGPGPDGMRPVGTLSEERGEFVFRYDRKFALSPGAAPIPGFPDLDEEYRSHDLWPFFAVRIPPTDRMDVREALERRGLRREQTLEVLGALAKRSISNPYRLDLVVAP